MPTPKQERLAKELVENLSAEKPKTKGEMVVDAGYSKRSADGNSGLIIEQEGVKQALVENYGFTEDNAKKVVSSLMLDETQEGNVRLKAADMTFKVHGSYAAEKQIVQSVNVSGTPQDYVEAEALRLKYEEEAKKLLL